MNCGYIYIRTNEYWDTYNIYKLGKTKNILDRDQGYITGEVRRGHFVMVVEIQLTILDELEKHLMNYFNDLNLHIDGGEEFFKKDIIYFIIPYLEQNNIQYKILSKEEISCLTRTKRIYDNNKKPIELNNVIYKPRDYQEIIIAKSNNYFQTNEKGLLIIPCGVGKTLISLWITQKLNFATILIGVPNKLILKQWKEVVCILFQDMPYFIVSGGVDVENITDFLEKNCKKCIIITTYASSHKIYTATQYLSFVFDMKINDEAHHLTAINMQLENTAKKYIQMLNIQSAKQLSLTATLKQLESMNEDDNIISNDNVAYFGEIIDKKCLLWAINENIICDYVIQTIVPNDIKLEQQTLYLHIIEENDKRLFLSAFASLTSIMNGHSHHLLIYSNNKENSLKIIQYIKLLLNNQYFDIPDLYYSNYHSEMKSKDQIKILDNFERTRFAIISNVYCLGEGFDKHIIDGVVFAENMSSNIRIVQSALRASRKNKFEPDKITKIILPILIKEDWLENNDNTDLKKVKEVIHQMSLEDETIYQKIKVFKMDIDKQITKQFDKKDTEKEETINEIYKYDEELTQKLLLKTFKRISSTITYEKAKKIIADKNIKSKKKYFELCEKDFRLPKEPEIEFKGTFANWIDYLSIERIYYDLQTCKNKANEYLLSHPELKKHYLNLSFVCDELCKIDASFPPNDLWIEYYGVNNLQDIIIANDRNNKKKLSFIV